MHDQIDDRVIDILIVLTIIVTIILKLQGIITLSWLSLTAIIWVPMLFGLAGLIGITLIFIINKIIDKIKENNKVNE